MLYLFDIISQLLVFYIGCLPRHSCLVVKYIFHIGIDRDKPVDDWVAVEKDTTAEEVAERKEAGGLPYLYSGCEKGL